jgi:hypothetical protein
MAQAKKKSRPHDSKHGAAHDATVAAEIGAGILAAAGAAAAGYYYVASDGAKQHRKKTAKWANDMKNNVVKEAKKQMKTAAKLDKQAVAAIVDRATQTYQGVRTVKREDLVAAANELKQNWQMIEAELSAAAKRSGAALKGATHKAVKIPSKKAVKKATKKAAPKKASKKAVKTSAKTPAKKSAKKTARTSS